MDSTEKENNNSGAVGSPPEHGLEKKEKKEKNRKAYHAINKEALLYAMGDKKGVEHCNTWITDEQIIHETADYGSNKKSVGDALEEQRRRTRMVKGYTTEVDKAAKKAKEEATGEQLKASYQALEAVANKRLYSLEGIAEIVSLEDVFGFVSNEFAQKATDLASSSGSKPVQVPEKDGEGFARASQGSILAVRKNWQWISTLMKCSETHLQHAASYHQFYNDANEFSQWMPIALDKATAMVQMDEEFRGDTVDAQKLHKELKGVLALFLFWEAKANSLFDRSKHIVPVHMRTKKVDHNIPVTSLCDYKTNEIKVTEGEDLTLLDNTKTSSWLVRNIHLQEAMVPAVTCVIGGPDEKAVEVATRLRLQLLGIWTNNVKRIGKTLVSFLLLVFRGWSAEEAELIKSMPNAQKNEVSKTLDYVEDTLLPYWADYPDFQKLQERLKELRALMAQSGESTEQSENLGQALVVQTKVVEDLLKKYQDFWRSWMTYKILTEVCKHPELILIVNKWEELKFIELAELLKRWHIGFDFADEQVVEEEELTTEALPMLEEITATAEKVTETAEAESLSSSEHEEKKTFVITGVKDPRTKKDISMHEAVEMGIINNNEGTYCNPDTGVTMPLPDAMNAGHITVELTSTKKTKERKRDIGLITIRTQKESRPYTVKGVIDAVTEKKMSVEEAVSKGILDQKRSIYYNKMEKREMSLTDAIDSGLLVVEFDKEAEVSEPEVVTRTYAIHAVVDQKRRKRVPFSEAVNSGLINTETGAYRNNKTGEEVYVGDAIKRGLIKATVVDDPSSMDIAAENRVVVDKMQEMKSKLLSPLKSLAALKKAGGKGSGK